MAQVRIKQIQGLGGTLSTIGAVVDDLTNIVTIRQIDEVPQSSANTNIYLSSQIRKSNICTINVNGIDSTESFSFEKDSVSYTNDGSLEIPAGSLLIFDSVEAGYELSNVDEITLVYESGLIDDLPTDLANGIFEGTQYDVEGIEYSGGSISGDVTGNLIPDTDEAYDLGSPTKKFRDLYLSGNTLYMGGQPLSVVNGSLVLNGTPVTGTPTASGTSGTSGVSGAQGSPGTPGSPGFSGAIGAQGAKGKDGANGTSGIDGSQGAQGANGIPGSDGAAGVQGAQGAQGAPAPSGPITAKWKWSTATIPTSGKVTTSSGSMHAPTISGITFHDIDSDGINRSATLNAVGPGSIIMLSTFGSPYAGTSEWTVTSVSASGSYVTFNVNNNTSNGAVQPPANHLVYTELSVIPQTIQGAQGFPGWDGAQGAPGSRGADGNQGAQGASGVDGNDGTSGLNGPKSANDAATLGIGDYVGQLGFTIGGGVFQWDGNSWIQRADLNGPQGAQGSPGATGPAGLGSTGAQGAAGIAGAQGANGVDGAQGANGIDGAQGANGVDGAQGAAGIAGAQGANGVDGAQGANGADGAQGAAGIAGAQGANGVDGAQGAVGPAGSSGAGSIIQQQLIMSHQNGGNSTDGDAHAGVYPVDWHTLNTAYTSYPRRDGAAVSNNHLNLTNFGDPIIPDYTYTYSSQTLTNQYIIEINDLVDETSGYFHHTPILNAIDSSMKYQVGSMTGFGRSNLVNSTTIGTYGASYYPISINEFVLYAIKEINGVLKPILLDYTDAKNSFTSDHGNFTLQSTRTATTLIDLTDCIAIGVFYLNKSFTGNNLPLMFHELSTTSQPHNSPLSNKAGAEAYARLTYNLVF